VSGGFWGAGFHLVALRVAWQINIDRTATALLLQKVTASALYCSSSSEIIPKQLLKHITSTSFSIQAPVPHARTTESTLQRPQQILSKLRQAIQRGATDFYGRQAIAVADGVAADAPAQFL